MAIIKYLDNDRRNIMSLLEATEKFEKLAEKNYNITPSLEDMSETFEKLAQYNHIAPKTIHTISKAYNRLGVAIIHATEAQKDLTQHKIESCKWRTKEALSELEQTINMLSE